VRGLPGALRAATGARLVKDINTNQSGTGAGILAAVGSVVYFAGTDVAHGTELWRSDGTELGTFLVKDIVPGLDSSGITEMVAMGASVFFVAGGELWRSNGTDGGTVRVKDIRAGTADGVIGLRNVNGKLYFGANDGTSGTEPYTSDGTENGTSRLKDVVTGIGGSNPLQFVAAGSFVYFSIQEEFGASAVWRTDGTETGTVVVKTFPPNLLNARPDGLVAVGNRIVFVAVGGTAFQFWGSDGTEAGTQVLLGVGLFPFPVIALQAAGGVVYFAGAPTSNNSGLWKTDGTTMGTAQVKSVGTLRITNVISTTATTFFSIIGATDELWKTDGTGPGTTMVASGIPSGTSQYHALGGQVLFSAVSLWRSDGTQPGTGSVADILPSNRSDDYAVAGSSLFFVAYGAGKGRELWKSDGTPGGTSYIEDINTITDSSNPGLLTSFKDRVFFVAYDPQFRSELRSSDGTEAGTIVVKDILSDLDVPPDNLTVAANLLFFSASATGAFNSRELWTSDGTEMGTAQLKEINPARPAPRRATSRRSQDSSCSPRTTAPPARSSGAATGPRWALSASRTSAAGRTARFSPRPTSFASTTSPTSRHRTQTASGCGRATAPRWGRCR